MPQHSKARRQRPRERVVPGSPFLTHIFLPREHSTPDSYTSKLPILGRGLDVRIDSPVTFFVGENGSGKSTILEAIAWSIGFGSHGGSRDHQFAETDDGRTLGRQLRLAWRQKVADGFFLRAETFFNFASYLEEAQSTFRRYGGRALHAQSHGEAFLAVFNNRVEDGIYLLDEPEAALSPQRQLAFLRTLHDHSVSGAAQFIIATHSPILLAFPGATILSLDGDSPVEVEYRETSHYRITREFLEAPERFFKHLLQDD